MTLQEFAFMADLIKNNYRRRMFWFLLHVCIFLISLLLTSYAIITAMSGVIQIASLLVSAVILAPVIIQNADSVKLPWAIKKRQADALNQLRKVDFEELNSYVPLKEYFEI